MDRIEDVLEEIRAIGARLDSDDQRRHFNATYLRTTEAVAAELRRGGFRDPVWSERLDAVFASLYIDAFHLWESGATTPEPWRIAFEATRGERLPPLRHVLLGMNAHVNYDLPRALIAVMTDAEFDDPEVTALRSADHRHIDGILAARVAAEDRALVEVERSGDRDLIDRLLRPFNRLATKRFLRESRQKVWVNARILCGARRTGDVELTAKLAELEHRCAGRVADLTRPGRVLLELARHGFGVTLDPD